MFIHTYTCHIPYCPLMCCPLSSRPVSSQPTFHSLSPALYPHPQLTFSCSLFLFFSTIQTPIFFIPPCLMSHVPYVLSNPFPIPYSFSFSHCSTVKHLGVQACIAAISSFRAPLTSRCLCKALLPLNSSETMIAVKAWPHPPDISWIWTWVVEILD